VLRFGKKEPNAEELRQALAHLERAAHLAPNESKIHYALARVYRRMGPIEDAAKEMRAYQELKSKEDKLNPRFTALRMQGK